MKISTKLHLRRSTAAVLVSLGALAASALPQIANAQVDVSELRQGAPSTHTVVKGDTLWHIAGKFLEKPWKWPDLWALNKAEVKNPHLIYPGNVLRLEVVNGKAQLRVGAGDALGELVLKPGMRVEQLAAEDAFISAVPISQIRTFLTRPLLVDVDAFQKAPKVLAGTDGRIVSGKGRRLYATGIEGAANTLYSVYRQGAPLVDPDSGEILALEAVHLGSVKIVRAGEASLLEVLESNQEITPGDRLMPVEQKPVFSPVMRAAPQTLRARVVRVHDGQSSSLLADTGMNARTYDREGGPMSVVILSRGTVNGVEAGHVVQLMTSGATVGRGGTFGFINGRKAPVPVKLPDEANGQAIVFKAFDRVSYALVMSASRSVRSGDAVQAP